jgi:hypothetical protein
VAAQALPEDGEARDSHRSSGGRGSSTLGGGA